MSSISIFDIFKIGIGPSSSHTVGPMKAAGAFVSGVEQSGGPVHRLEVRLYGSLAHTGKGHGTDSAILLGLNGADPRTVDPNEAGTILGNIRSEHSLDLPGVGTIEFDPDTDLVFDFGEPPYPFSNGAGLLAQAENSGLSIPELVYQNELSWRSKAEFEQELTDIWEEMQACVQRGLHTDGVLPGRMAVTRRAARLYRSLKSQESQSGLENMDWVNAYAIAVNEENAAGGRVVTSPTNGAAGIIPAVLHYYKYFVADFDEDGVRRFLLAAGAIGILYKINASISGAEMGCQGEVGVACSMAAAGLVAAFNGSAGQLENAAEIGMEHNLGLTCDPIGGLVQIPCIERNAMGSVKAINAARLAMQGDGSHNVSLDQVISTMRQTGLDMSTIYKETSQGGLAVNVPEC